jgi:hypothetical protein
MMLLTTDEARVVHAVLEFGMQMLGMMSEADQNHFWRARKKLSDHVGALVQSMAMVNVARPEPAA